MVVASIVSLPFDCEPAPASSDFSVVICSDLLWIWSQIATSLASWLAVGRSSVDRAAILESPWTVFAFHCCWSLSLEFVNWYTAPLSRYIVWIGVLPAAAPLILHCNGKITASGWPLICKVVMKAECSSIVERTQLLRPIIGRILWIRPQPQEQHSNVCYHWTFAISQQMLSRDLWTSTMECMTKAIRKLSKTIMMSFEPIPHAACLHHAYDDGNRVKEEIS